MNEPKHRSPFVLVGRLIVLVKPMLPIMLAAIVMGVAGKAQAPLSVFCRHCPKQAQSAIQWQSRLLWDRI